MSVRSIFLFGCLDDDRQSAEASLLVYAALGHLGLFAEARMKKKTRKKERKKAEIKERGSRRNKKGGGGGGGGENNVYYDVEKLSPVSTAAVFTRVHCD